jgi:release factor glutamine methyltransferase
VSGLSGLRVDQVRRDITARFKSAGLDSPELDARLLIGAALNLDHTGLSIQTSRIVTRDEADTIEKHVLRRIAREPVARILGRKEFWGLDFQLSPATLVPRPDTETLVSAALEFLQSQNKLTSDIRIADLGTGSGAILLALLSECPAAHGVGTDISEAALATANINAQNLGPTDRTAFLQSDYAAALSGPFDLIVSNPPYIRSDEIDTLEIDVRDHDPRLALDGGEDGLAAYRIIAGQAVGLLVTGGALIVEVGHDQAADVAKIMQASGLTAQTPPRADLGGIHRVVTGLKS